MNDQDLWKQLRWALPLGTALVSAVVGKLMGLELGILVLAGGVLVGVIFVLWHSLQGLTGEAELTLEEALSLAAPSAEEEEKRSVLRTLKDLEYEKSVGKISDEDYAELVAKYSARAKELIQVVDADMDDARAQVERLLSKRLRDDEARAKDAEKQKGKSQKRGAEKQKPAAKRQEPAESALETVDAPEASEATPSDAPDSGPAQTSTPRPTAAAVAPSEERGIECPECTTSNDADARFCKSCGTPLEAAS